MRRGRGGFATLSTDQRPKRLGMRAKPARHPKPLQSGAVIVGEIENHPSDAPGLYRWLRPFRCALTGLNICLCLSGSGLGRRRVDIKPLAAADVIGQQPVHIRLNVARNGCGDGRRVVDL